MYNSLAYSLAALASLVPAAILPLRRPVRDGLFWAALALAVVGPVSWALAQFAGDWRTGFAAALWASIAVTIALFGILALVQREVWRLMPLLAPYLLLVGVIATAFRSTEGTGLPVAALPSWLEVHIVLSLLTYALLTLAAIAAVAALVQERSLKKKIKTVLSRILPSVADSEGLFVRLLAAAEVVLALGFVSGMATLYADTGRIFELDHKTALSLAVFLVVAGLLAAHHLTGIRGRRATRWALGAWLFLTLAYPGVKFVSQVILGR